jgi:type II secretory ATPase GspE/PulE/Tfp pilus assembly ATPase PilB-like protein
MRRLFLLFAGALLVVAGSAQAAWAQETAAAPALEDGWSGPGFYLNLVKLGAAWLLFLLWVYTTDWVSRDAQQFKLNFMRWNPIVFGSFLGAFVLLWMLPWFAAGFSLLAIAYLAPLTAYILQRNRKVSVADRVLTRRHLRQWWADHAAKLGVKVDTEEKDPHETGPPVILTARGGASQREDNVNLLGARQAPGFTNARHLIADAIFRRADAITLDFGPESMNVRYLIDGVWLDGDPWDRQEGDQILEALKLLCGLNPADRQSRQKGLFLAQYEKTKFNASLISQGTKTGERAAIQLESKQTQFDTLDDLGMRPKIQELLKELIARPKGLVLFSAPPASGLRSTVNVVLRASDRFIREFMAFEEESNRYEPVENVPATTYNAAAGQKPMDVLPNFFLQEPNVAVVRDLVDGEMVTLLCEEVDNERVIISTIRAKDCIDAILRVLALRVPPKQLAKALSGVVCQRLIRKLCDQCKQAFTPSPELLRKLGIPEGRVEALYRPPEPVEGEKLEFCHACNGVGYFGRTALYELLIVDDDFRKVLAGTPQPEALREAGRRAGMKTFQEEGIALVAKGVTSIPELMRVLKQ